MCAGLSLEMKSCGNNFGIIKDHNGIVREQIRQVSEDKMVDFSLSVAQ